MSIEMELKDLILAKYKSLREFAIKIDMPYSTLDTILKRGVNKANVANILAICKELNIDAESLGDGKIIYKNDDLLSQVEPTTVAAHLPEGVELTEEEQEQLDDYIKFLLSKRKE